MDGSFTETWETRAEAAVRLGLSERTLKEREARLKVGRPPGRPRKGQTWRRPQSEWGRIASVPARRRGPRPRPPVPSKRTPWTPEEDAILLRLTTPTSSRNRLRFNWPAILKALPGRGKPGCQDRRCILAESNAPAPWSSEEDAILRQWFGRVTVATILRKLPSRSHGAVVQRAKILKLTGVPAGYLLFDAAARKFGYHPHTLRDLLARHGVRLEPYRASQSHGPRTKPWRMVKETAVARAVARDLAQETLFYAADRHGVPVVTLRQWMRDEGHEVPVGRGCNPRFDGKEIDQVVAARKAKEATT